MKQNLLTLQKEAHQGFFWAIRQSIAFILYFPITIRIMLNQEALRLLLFPSIQVFWDQM